MADRPVYQFQAGSVNQAPNQRLSTTPGPYGSYSNQMNGNQPFMPKPGFLPHGQAGYPHQMNNGNQPYPPKPYVQQNGQGVYPMQNHQNGNLLQSSNSQGNHANSNQFGSPGAPNSPPGFGNAVYPLTHRSHNAFNGHKQPNSMPNFPHAAIQHPGIQKLRFPPSPGKSPTNAPFPSPALKSPYQKYPIPQGKCHASPQGPVIPLCGQGAPGTNMSPEQLGPPPTNFMGTSQIPPGTDKEDKSCPTLDITNWKSQFPDVRFPNARNIRKKPENGPLFDLSEYDKKSLDFDRPPFSSTDTIDPKLSIGKVVWRPAFSTSHPLPASWNESEENTDWRAPAFGSGLIVSKYCTPVAAAENLANVRDRKEWATLCKDPMFAAFLAKVETVDPNDIDCKTPEGARSRKASDVKYMDVMGNLEAALSTHDEAEIARHDAVIEAKIREVEQASSPNVAEPSDLDQRLLALGVEGPAKPVNLASVPSFPARPLAPPPRGPKSMLRLNTSNISNFTSHGSRPNTPQDQSRRSSLVSANSSPHGPFSRAPSVQCSPGASPCLEHNGKPIPTGPKIPMRRCGSNQSIPTGPKNSMNHSYISNNGFQARGHENRGFDTRGIKSSPSSPQTGGFGEPNRQSNNPNPPNGMRDMYSQQNHNSPQESTPNPNKRTRPVSDDDVPSDVKLRQDVGPSKKRRVSGRPIDDVYGRRW